MRCLWLEYFKRPHTPGSQWERECPLRNQTVQEVLGATKPQKAVQMVPRGIRGRQRTAQARPGGA